MTVALLIAYAQRHVALQSTQGIQFTEPLDMVYAVMGLSERSLRLKPNYSLTIEQLMTQVVFKSILSSYTKILQRERKDRNKEKKTRRRIRNLVRTGANKQRRGTVRTATKCVRRRNGIVMGTLTLRHGRLRYKAQPQKKYCSEKTEP